MDLLFLNATVVDGTGKPPYQADVAVKDGLIQQVGPDLSGMAAARTVDASGLHLMPGWTDVHTHYDAQCMWDPLLSPSGPAGVTTVVMGNCGVGFAPADGPQPSQGSPCVPSLACTGHGQGCRMGL